MHVVLAFYRANKFLRGLPQTYIIIKFQILREERVKYKIPWSLTKRKKKCILLVIKKVIYLFVFLIRDGEFHKDLWPHFQKQIWILSAKIQKQKNDFLHGYINKKWVTSPKIQNDYQNQQDIQGIAITAIL